MIDNYNDPRKTQVELELEVYLKNLDNTLLNRDWLEKKRREELLDLVQYLAVELYKQSTTQLKNMERQRQTKVEFEAGEIEEVETFTPLPRDTDGLGERMRIALISSGTRMLNKGYEIVGSAVLGREDGSFSVDLDLTEFGPEVKGVSRRHAELKVIEGKLYLLDLNSSNGTYIEGDRVPPDKLVEIKNGTVVVLGALTLMIRIIS